MSVIRKLSSGRFQAIIRLKKIQQSKTFTTELKASLWAEKLEHNIRTIPTLSPAELSTLTSNDINDLGGHCLFTSLGVDLFAIQNETKLAAINKLNKDELLQLSPHRIDAMGGVELFQAAGARVRYKTFAEVAEEYLEQWVGKDSTNQKQRLAYWVSVFGERIITDMDVEDIRDIKDLLLKKQQRPTTIIRKKAVLSSVFKFALSQGYVDKNIVSNVKITNDVKTRNRLLDDAERAALLKACKTSDYKRLYLIVLLGLSTGARKSEILGLRWNDINFKLRTALLNDTKNGSKRTLALPPAVINELKKFQEVGNGLLFAGNTNKPKDIRKAWLSVLKKAGISAKDILNSDGSVKIEKFTFHCLRHGFCSALSAAGKELSVIAEMAGHKSIQTTMRYIHQGNEEKIAIADELAQAMGI